MSGRGTEGSPRILSTVTRALEVIQTLEELDGAGVTEIASSLDISKSAAYNYLMTLEDQNLVVKEGSTYSLSLQFLLLGEYVRNHHSLYQSGKEPLEELAEETSEYAHLATVQHGLGINLYKIAGEKGVGSDYQTEKLQRPDYLHVSATGKSMLAHLPGDEVETIIDRYGLPQKTENTITDRETLFEELATIRERGYAYNDEEEIEGLRAIGAPILDKSNCILGSVSVSGPLRRMDDPDYHDTLIEHVTNTANIIEVNVNMAKSNEDPPSYSI